MHLSLDLTVNPHGQLEGTVDAPTGTTAAFCGTLELLKVLQDVTDGAPVSVVAGATEAVAS